MAASGLTGMLGSAGDDMSPVGGPAPFDASPWMDSFDDGSLVNSTIDAEVVGGQVQLEAGKATGLVASVPITAPPGYRYDILIVEVDTPGGSTVEVSVLNATEESTKVGYVNEPIPGFLKLAKTQIPLTGVGTGAFPQIRLQADLSSSGTDRPALLEWTLHYVADDMWRDEFWGDGKVAEGNRVVFDGEHALIDMSMGNLYITGYEDHAAYPPIITNRGRDDRNRLEMGVFYTNAAGDGYRGRTQMYAENPGGFVAGDLDKDGYIDVLVANFREGSDYTRNSWILWGNASGTWDVNRRTDLPTDRGRTPALGDVDGDGDLDVIIACGGDSSGNVRIWINPGTRTYSATHDIQLPGQNIAALAAADLDQDGFDDVVVAENYDTGSGMESRIYMGSRTGPDGNADINLPTGSCQDVALADFNGDGWIDVAFANTVVIGGNDRSTAFYGSSTGPDPSDVFYADVPDDLATIAAGDINGDGYDDFVIGRTMSGPRMYQFYGAASGLSNSRTDDPRIETSQLDNLIIDLDNDGFDDVVSAGWWQGRIEFYKGSASGADGTRDGYVSTSEPRAIAVAVERAKLKSLRGSFISDTINRPLDQKWDILVLDADLPAGTDMEVSILDSGMQPVLGYEKLEGPDIDLSAITIPAIHVQVTLISNDLVTSPRLDRMFVKWMPPNVWRDEFYGMAKVDKVTGLVITNDQMTADPALAGGKEIVFSNLRTDSTFQITSDAFRDAGGMDYTSLAPLRFRVPSGAADVVVTDANSDGYADVLFPVLQTSNSNYIADSPLFLGSPVGFDTVPTTKFATIGARDAVVTDLNKDGYMDVVFAQEQDAGAYNINSTLFWGDEDGWNTTPDVEFVTTGASDVVAADFDKDGLLDLAFACFRSTLTTAIDSKVFLQTADGFDGTSADQSLPTRGARGVAAGDIDEDGWVDLVFANSISGGFADVFSYVYWGGAGGTFGTTAANLPTRGAEGVALADVNNDDDLDILFANHMDNSQSRLVDSYIYLGSGSRTLSGTADVSLPTLGAYAVTVGDLDGTGWRDVLFACGFDGASYDIESRVFLGDGAGIDQAPDITVPTHGASGVALVDLVPKDKAGYLSQVISPKDPSTAGVFHTLKYNAVSLPSGHTGTISVLDADTGEVLASTALVAGMNEFTLADKFRIREHDAIQLLITVDGLDPVGSLALDDLWLNWTPRNKAPPKVTDLVVSGDSVLRTQTVRASIAVIDEYDYLDELTVVMEHRISGSGDPWTAFMISGLGFVDGEWKADISPRVNIPVGVYDFRIKVTDTDDMDSGWQVYTDLIEVLNNLPSAPEVAITPARAVATSELEVEIVSSAVDIESQQITYEYSWYLNGTLVPDLTSARVPASRLVRGQNWSVEVRANDTDDLGPAAVAWKVISNAPPFPSDALPEFVYMDEDTQDSDWIVLSTVFDDPDGDTLTWSVDPMPTYVMVDIDPDTGRVTLSPIGDWNGEEKLVFYASDGEFRINQSVTVRVAPVNDPPVWVTVNGEAYDGGTVELEVLQDETLTIDVVVFDVEDDEILYRVTDTQIILNMTTGRMTFTPDNDDIGWLNFSMMVNDDVDRDEKIQADFSIRIINVNDIMEEPRIISPSEMDEFKWNTSVGLRGVCTDPDEQWGQELTYTWSSNASGELGTGPSINFRFTESGIHVITLTVSDGEFELTRSINISVRAQPAPPPPPPPPDDEGIPMWMILLAVLVVVGAVVAILVVVRRRGEPEPEPVPALSPEEQKRKDLEDFRDAVAATATAFESEWEDEQRKKKEESIEVVGTGMVPSESAGHKMRLSERTSDETAKLWADMEKETPAVDEAEKEALAKENRRRKIMSAIQALPYGIPAPALRHISPDQLATEMVEGATHELPDGTVLVAVRGKWYHGDPEDSSKFLMPYESKEKVPTSTSASSEWEEE
jgi:hypothetical protein